MSAILRILFLIYGSSVICHAQIIAYPQTYHLKGEVDHMQFFSLENTSRRGYKEIDRNTIYFNATNQPERLVLEKNPNADVMTYEYDGNLLRREVAPGKQGKTYVTVDYNYEQGVLKERTITYDGGGRGMNTHFTYQHLPNDTIIGESEDRKEIYLGGRRLSTHFKDRYRRVQRQIFTYNEYGDLSKTSRFDGNGKMVVELQHFYEYDEVGNYVQKVTVNQAGDTTAILLRRIVYRGPSATLKMQEDFVGKWLLVVQHPVRIGSFVIDFRKDRSLYCPGAANYDLSETGQWAVDLKNQRIKVRLAKMGFRVKFDAVNDHTLQIRWNEMEDTSRPRIQDSKDTFLYKIN